MSVTIVSSTKSWLGRIFEALSHSWPRAEHPRSERVVDGVQAFEEYWAREMSDPETRAIYERVKWKCEPWRQLIDARLDSGLTTEEMAKRMKVKLKDVILFEEDGDAFSPLDIWYEYAKALGLTLKFAVEPGSTEQSSNSATEVPC